MKITDVKLQVLRREVPKGTIAADFGGYGGGTEMAVLRLLTDEGLEGNTFVGSFNVGGRLLFEPIIAYLKPAIMGMDIADREWLWSRVFTRLGQMAHRFKMPTVPWSMVDVALWDLAGKAAGMPIYQMLGAQRRKVLAYASSPYHKDIANYVEEGLEYRRRGFKAYKIHPGEGDPKRVKEIARRVRDAVGDDMALMIDNSQLLTFQDALSVGRVLDELHYYWFEDAIRYTDMDGLIELSRRLDTPIAATDHGDFRFYEAAEYVERKAIRILRSDSPKMGITGLKKLCTLCEAFGLNCEIHHGGNSLLNAANLHVTLSVANCDFYEWLLPSEANQFGLVEDITVDGEGYVHAPTKPGLGYDIDWELVERLTDRVL